MTMGVDSILIDDASARVSDRGIDHSATFTNTLDALITFDALIRLDSQNEVLRLDARTITLGPGNSLTIEGIFSVTEPGSYVVRWEALSPPPGEPLAAGRQVTVVIIEEVPDPPPEEPEEPPVLEEEGVPKDPEEPLDPAGEPAQDNPREEELPAEPLMPELADPLVEEPPPGDPLVAPDMLIEEPPADPLPPDPEEDAPPADPVLHPDPLVEEPARDEDAPVGDAREIVPPVGELPSVIAPAPPAPPPPRQLEGNPGEQAVDSTLTTLVIVAIGVVIWASIMGIILRRKSQNWKYEPIFTDG